MIEQAAYTVEPWGVRETELDLDRLAQSESVFALSNGHIGVRANLDEGEPNGIPGTYLNALFEQRPLPYAEAGYGYPEAGETVVNMTNGKIIRLLVDDTPFDIRYGELLEHERAIDFRSGILTRSAHWRSPTGREVKVVSERLVSFLQRAVMAIRYRVEPVSESTRLVLQSELVTNEPRPAMSDDPRAAAALEAPLVSEEFVSGDQRAVLVHRTKRSGLRAAAAMDHEVSGPDDLEAQEAEAWEDLGRFTVTTSAAAGEAVTLTKFVAYGWSSQRSTPALRDQVGAALAEARHAGWDELVRCQRRVPRRLLGGGGRRGRGRRRAAAGGPLRPLPLAAGGCTRGGAGDPGEGADRARLRRPRLLGHRGLRAAAAHLRDAARRVAGAEAGGSTRSSRPANGPRSSASRARPSPGGRSAAASAAPTGRPAPAPSTSMATSPRR